jgi:hypothetical protein
MLLSFGLVLMLTLLDESLETCSGERDALLPQLPKGFEVALEGWWESDYFDRRIIVNGRKMGGARICSVRQQHALEEC